MIICFPVKDNQGLESKVYEHFGSAPFFILFDSNNEQVAAIANHNLEHIHGACNPARALNGHSVDVVVVTDIGAGALSKLQQLNIRAFQSQAPTIKENIVLLHNQSLPEFSLQYACKGHGHGGGCCHS